jgi:fatty acid desaturase
MYIVAHHIDSTIPHYNAKKATEIIKEKFPDAYLFESSPITDALWRLSADCHHVVPRVTRDATSELYVFANN